MNSSHVCRRFTGQIIDQGLNCAASAANPYAISATFCDNVSSFNACLYFATMICSTLIPTLNQWAAAMFALVVTGLLASFSGCCLNGCCRCKESFDTAIVPVSVAVVQAPQAAAQQHP